MSAAASTIGSETAKATLCTNATLAILAQDAGIRPLDALLDAGDIAIPDHQRIVVKGKTLAIALTADAHLLAYRADIFEKSGLNVPQTLFDIPATIKTLRTKTDLETPLLLDRSDGWSLAQIVLSHLDSPIDKTTGDIDLNTQAAQELLTLLLDLAGDASMTTTIDDWSAGHSAMMLTPGNAMHRLSKIANVTARPLMQPNSEVPATPIWWQGWAIPADQSDIDVKAAFDAMTLASDPAGLTPDLSEQALWLMNGFKPGQVHEGTLKAVAAGAQAIPIDLCGGLLHAALADVLPAFVDGTLTVVQTLTKAQSAYRIAARNSGTMVDV